MPVEIGIGHRLADVEDDALASQLDADFVQMVMMLTHRINWPVVVVGSRSLAVAARAPVVAVQIPHC